VEKAPDRRSDRTSAPQTFLQAASANTAINPITTEIKQRATRKKEDST